MNIIQKLTVALALSLPVVGVACNSGGPNKRLEISLQELGKSISKIDSFDENGDDQLSPEEVRRYIWEVIANPRFSNTDMADKIAQVEEAIKKNSPSWLSRGKVIGRPQNIIATLNSFQTVRNEYSRMGGIHEN